MDLQTFVIMWFVLELVERITGLLMAAKKD